MESSKLLDEALFILSEWVQDHSYPGRFVPRLDDSYPEVWTFFSSFPIFDSGFSYPNLLDLFNVLRLDDSYPLFFFFIIISIFYFILFYFFFSYPNC